MRGNGKGVGEREKALLSHPSFNPNRVTVGHSWRQMGGDDWMTSVLLSFLFLALSWLTICPLPILSLYFITFFLVFFLPPLLLSLSTLFPLSLPPGYRMKAGETAPQGKKKRWGEIFLSFHHFFLLSFKRVTFFSSTRTRLHIQYAKFTTFAENRHPLGCWNQQTSVTPILLQRKHFLNLEKQPILCDWKRNWIW